MLVDAKVASRQLSISERKLWSLTASGEITSVRIGRSVRYAADDVAAFIAANKTGGQQ